MPMTMNGGDFAALQQDFERMAQVAEPAQIQGTLEEAAQPILEQMRQNASSNPSPRSGKLRGALNTGNAGKKGGASITIGVHRKDWSGDEYYPAYVEFGHGGPRPAPPHPFVRPAIDERGDEAIQVLIDKVAQVLK